MKLFRRMFAVVMVGLVLMVPARAQGQYQQGQGQYQQGQGQGQGQPPQGHSMWSRAVSQLGLTTAQQSQLRATFEAYDQQMHALHQACMTQLRSILTAQQQAALEQQRSAGQGPPRFDALGLSADQMSRVEAIHQQYGPQMEAASASLAAQVEPQLTAQQKTAFEQMLNAERPPRR